MAIILAKIQWSFNDWRGWDQQLYSTIKVEKRSSIASYSYVEEHGFGFESWNFYEGFHPDYYYGYVIEPRPIEAIGKINLIFFISFRKTPKTSLLEDTYLIGFYGYAEVSDKYFEDVRGLLLMDALSKAKTLPPNVIEELNKVYFYIRSKKKYSALLPVKMKFLWKRYGISPLTRARFMYLTKDQAKKILNDIKSSLTICPCRNKGLEAVIDPTILTKIEIIEEMLDQGVYD